jgi:hypothetical protein
VIELDAPDDAADPGLADQHEPCPERGTEAAHRDRRDVDMHAERGERPVGPPAERAGARLFARVPLLLEHDDAVGQVGAAAREREGGGDAGRAPADDDDLRSRHAPGAQVRSKIATSVRYGNV